MKKVLSIILSIILVMGNALSVSFSTSAITIEEMDEQKATETTVFDFEDPSKFMVNGQGIGGTKVQWKVDAFNTLEYYNCGWGFNGIYDNPVNGPSDAEGSVVNSSSKVLRIEKLTNYSKYETSGGLVLNKVTGRGVEPYILQNNTTYTIELDYMIKSTHLYGEVQNPDGSGSVDISYDAEDFIAIGYGYKENTEGGYGAIKEPVKNVETIASYIPNRDADGYFTACDGVKEVGNWYHASVTFTTGCFEDLYSKNNAPFLIIYTSKYTGSEMLIDNIVVGKTKTYSVVYDFEDKDFMKVGYQNKENDKVSWQDDNSIIEYHYSGWGFTAIADNPVKGETGAPGSIVNNSDKTLEKKMINKYVSYPVGGGLVINRQTDKGVEPLILEESTTYTVEFDYIVCATHETGTFQHPTDAAQPNYTISASAEDVFSFGYGYKLDTREGFAPIREAYKTVAKVVSYKYDRDGEKDTYYTATKGDGTTETRPVGSWYHESYEFTTGTFTSIYPEPVDNAPFLIFYTSVFNGGHIMVDNIKVTKHITVNLNLMNGTASDSSVTGKVGETINFPIPKRYGYEFTGWYTDGTYTEKFDSKFTADIAGATAFAGWEQGINTFENYTAPTNSSNGSRFSWVTNALAFRGKGSIKYLYSSGFFDNLTRTNANNYFVISPLEKDDTYRVTFKYYLKNGVNTTVYPVTVGNSNSSSTGRKEYKDTGAQIVIDSSGAGRWHTASLVFTSDMTSGYNNFGLHIHANSNSPTELYIDDVKIVPVENGSGALTIGGGKYGSVAAGASTRTVYLGIGDKIDNSFVYNKGYAVEGWYKYSDFKEKVLADVYSAALKDEIATVYPKFSERVDLTAHGVKGRTGGFKEADYEDVLYYKGSSGTAPLASVTSGNTYMVEFLYKNKSGTNVTLSIEEGSFIARRNTPNTWCKGYIPVTADSTLITLSADGNSTLEIKDIYIRDITGKFYVIFDSTEFGGEVTAVYGVKDEKISFPANPIVSGMKFSGWYDSNQNLFEDTTFLKQAVYLKAEMEKSGKIVLGDCDGDEDYDTTDLAVMKLYLAKAEKQIAEGADINADGKVNAIDLVLLYKILAGI